MYNYELHFFRPDGTLRLRLYTAAENADEALRAAAKMGGDGAIKVFRGVERVRVRHRPAMNQMPDSPEIRAGIETDRAPKNFRD